MRVWYVYPLESADEKWHYYGFTSDLKKRYAQHMAGEVKSTRPHLPLSFRYYEAYDNEKAARLRERTLKKSRAATKAVLTRIKNTGA